VPSENNSDQGPALLAREQVSSNTRWPIEEELHGLVRAFELVVKISRVAWRHSRASSGSLA
jgi:hypothetical protein